MNKTYLQSYLLLVLIFWATCENQKDESNKLKQVEYEKSENELSDIAHKCLNWNYRSYVDCRNREKRQHHDSHIGGEKHACQEECSESECSTTSCLRDCNARCKKRLVETYSKTVETSFDCDGDICRPADHRPPNITLNLHLNNILPNVTVECDEELGPRNCTEKQRVVNITNVINNVNTALDCPYPGCNFYPYVHQQIPQIAISFNPGPVGGCPFPWNWPCFQQSLTSPVDNCSLCTHPFLRLQCNPVCLSNTTKAGTDITKYASRP